ncbi:MAG TPA: outer membrane lipoprotein carrier protein LolA [Pseudobdellovibrionaceae bacterium]|nr:outer membrane lipoprotein carrier protein LolA [Pseudobdellovibrionaceae bacterium]
MAEVEKDRFSEVFKKYNKSSLVSMDISKKVKSEILGTEKIQTGKLYFSNEKFRITFFEPQKEMIIYDGKTLWTEQILGSSASEKIQVGKLKITEANKSQILLSVLFDNMFFLKNFKRISTVKKGNLFIYSFKPLNSDLNILKLSMSVQDIDQSIVSITYEDDLNNQTELDFLNVIFSTQKQPDLFKYNPPKKAEVSNL